MALEKLAVLLEEIETEFGFKSGTGLKLDSPDRDKIEYMFFKIMYSKAKFLRKTR